MSLIKCYKFREIGEMQHFLQGGILGKSLTYGTGNRPGVLGLVGRTITFTTPALTYTFTSSSRNDDVLLLTDIKLQLENAQPLLKVMSYQNRIGFIQATPTTGIVLKGGPTGGHAVLTGTVNLNTLDYGAGGTVDTKTLKVKIDSGTLRTVTFSAPTNANGIINQINATTGLSGVARLSGSGQLELISPTFGTSSKVELTNGTANTDLGFTDNQSDTGEATTDANQVLGFDAALDTVGKVYAAPGGSAPSLIWVNTISDNMHTLFTLE